jgi:hypothetical protein
VNPIKTEDNQQQTLSDEELRGRLDHIDAGLHDLLRKVDSVQAFIDEHRPALARAMSFVDPGAKLRAMVTGKKRS